MVAAFTSIARKLGHAIWLIPAFILVLALVVGYGISSRGSIDKTLFEDVSPSSGLVYQGMTFGGSWGDFDNDGWPDLYLPNHGNPGMLYRNLGNGRFENVTDAYIAAKYLPGDEHGAAWADYDNDGDQDLIVLHGGGRGVGSGPNRFYRNTGAEFEEIADSNGASNPYARARMPLWYDFNLDGKLDLFLGAVGRNDGKGPGAIFLQGANGYFQEANDAAPFESGSIPYCINSGLDDDQSGDLVCRILGTKNRTAHAFSGGKLPLTELNLIPATHFDDLAAADFNGDGRLDLYLARKSPDGAVLLGQPGVNELSADFQVNRRNADQKFGFSFRSSGELKFEIHPEYPKDSLALEQIHLGAEGKHPEQLSFALSPGSIGAPGMAAYLPGQQVGLYVGFTAPDQWQVDFSSTKQFITDSPEKNHQIALRIQSSQTISDTALSHGAEAAPPSVDRLLINKPGSMTKEGDARGIGDLLSGSKNVVAADFDNDMDVDLYIVASGSVANEPNLLYLNDGDGYFTPVVDAGGAAGSSVGVGDAVAVADFDQDGFLDLLVANGGSMGRSYGLAARDGGYQLFRNIGNDNHWLEIDLEGSVSNRDGIGARVYATAGGIEQVRLQDGGIHNHAQNHQRLHFGLADNVLVEKIRVIWPSGTEQQLTNVNANQLIRIKESAGDSE